AEIVGRAGLVPTRVVVVTRRLVQPEQHVVVWPHPFAGVDHASLERSIDISGRDKDDRGARSGVYLPAERTTADSQTLEVAARGDLLPQPSGHLRSLCPTRTRDKVEGAVRLLHQLESVSLVEPGRHALWVHAERNGVEPLDRGLFIPPVERSGHEGFDRTFRGRIETLQRLHDLAPGEDLD